MKKRGRTAEQLKAKIPSDLEDHSQDQAMGKPIDAPFDLDVNLTQEELDHSEWRHGEANRD
jgi:hypothetical protein